MPAKTKETNEKKVTKKTAKKTTVQSSLNKSKVSAKKAVKTSKKTTTKKNATPKAKNNLIKKTAKTKNKVKTSAKKVANKKQPINIVESYDLPYRYNETIVKILYQTPNTLFVYWDIADSDRENYIKHYGENFFNITRPVLIIHNDTMHYNFEIPINDFANSWYLHINDSKCDYRVELGRRPNYYNKEVTKEIEEKIKTDYIYVSTSNEIESPNDHVLFYRNGQKLYFKNIKSNSITEKVYKFKSKDSDNVKSIYKNYKLDEIDNRFDFRNPSSQNPTSNVM